MTPDQEPEPAGVAPEPSEGPQPARRGRRSRRGRGGRGRRRSQGTPQPQTELAEEVAEGMAGVSESAPVEPSSAPPRERHPALPAAVQEAIDDVNQIVVTLRSALDDMEEVLETLELAERQKTADEHELETLRRSLRQLHRPREGGQHGHHH